jgi:hypothetical protein
MTCRGSFTTPESGLLLPSRPAQHDLELGLGF